MSSTTAKHTHQYNAGKKKTLLDYILELRSSSSLYNQFHAKHLICYVGSRGFFFFYAHGNDHLESQRSDLQTSIYDLLEFFSR